ncbi:MAG TPA: HAD hydrolase family protein [Bacteroidales bacterium]|nr:HAD hydrolase family protein [Bacteroidales bacterium]HOR59792.1 HAD hydrolase family protein [Bacteroidales bacterium]HPL03790.1 HAD hydrolase family protein [Bacteroidales bacterium]
MINSLKNLNFKEKLKNLETLIFDIDGVLSSSNVLISETGELLRSTNVKDGYILRYAIKKGLRVIILSGGTNESVKIRYEALGIPDVIIKSKRKIDDFAKLKQKYNLDEEKTLYMGDDIPDYELLKTVGLACCPADAADEIKEISLYVSSKKSGEGCVRDITEQVLRAKGLWMDDDAFNT